MQGTVCRNCGDFSVAIPANTATQHRRKRAPTPARAAVEDRAARGGRLQTITYDEALRDKLIVGSPERVTDRLMGLQETLGLDGILCEMNCGTKIPHERVMKSLQLLREKVKPNFH